MRWERGAGGQPMVLCTTADRRGKRCECSDPRSGPAVSRGARRSARNPRRGATVGTANRQPNGTWLRAEQGLEVGQGLMAPPRRQWGGANGMEVGAPEEGVALCGVVKPLDGKEVPGSRLWDETGPQAVPWRKPPGG